MYVLSRLLRVSSGAALPQAIQMVNYILGHMNENHGTEFGAGVQVGGDPQIIGITGRFESLADYETLRGKLQTDQEYQAALQLGDHLYQGDTQDTIWNVRIPPGEPDAVTSVNGVQMELTRVDEAMTFATEAAAAIQGITGDTVGVATAVTGLRSRLVWVGYGPSLARLEENNDKLEASADYLDLFKKSAGVVVPNTLEQTIWTRVTE